MNPRNFCWDLGQTGNLCNLYTYDDAMAHFGQWPVPLQPLDGRQLHYAFKGEQEYRIVESCTRLEVLLEYSDLNMPCYGERLIWELG